MKDFRNWTEVTRGLYRYVVAANVCYEIHILYHEQDTDILTAKASLYLVGEWRTNGTNGTPSRNYFSRECLLAENAVQYCLEEAYNDNKNNMEVS